MSYKIRRSNERGFADHGWLNSYHTFSFGNYYDQNFMGFRDLRVINEDRVAAGQGFPPHSHQDMEIISIVLEGELAHQDSAGNRSILKANDVQAMSAGAGIKHSEYNPSTKDPVHFLQIWMIPDTKGITPRYQQTKLPSTPFEWFLIASKDGRKGSLIVQQDVNLYGFSLEKGKRELRDLAPNRHGWLQVIDGQLSFNEETLQTGDGVAFSANTQLRIQAITPCKILFFDLP